MGRFFGRRPDPTARIARAVATRLGQDERVLAAVYVQRPGTISAQAEGSGAVGAAVGGHSYSVGGKGEDKRLVRWARETAAFELDPDLARRTIHAAIVVTDSRLLLMRRSYWSGRILQELGAWPLPAIDEVKVPRGGSSLTIRRDEASLRFELPNAHRFLPDVYRDLPDLVRFHQVGQEGRIDGPERMLVVVAHPDDESFGCGSLLARAAAHGVRTTVCCATRGEAGTSELAGDRQALAAVRERELRAAADVLDVEQVVLFDWEDSDMAGTSDGNTLVSAPLDEVAAAITAVIDDVRPHLVVTLDASDGHRDHVQVRDATVRAVDDAAWPVPRLYLWCLARSLMEAWVDHLRTLDPTSDYLELGRLGTPDAEITTILDAADHYDRRWEAIRTHASQTSPYEALPTDLQRAFLATDRLKRLRPPWNGGPVEHEIF